MDAVDLDKITNFGGYPFSITLRINNKTISIMLVDKLKVSILELINLIKVLFLRDEASVDCEISNVHFVIAFFGSYCIFLF